MSKTEEAVKDLQVLRQRIQYDPDRILDELISAMIRLALSVQIDLAKLESPPQKKAKS